MYGAMNCIDLTAAACGEIVFDLIAELGVPLSVEMATHVYLAILTDTGGFHYSHISPRTFDICRRCVEAGLDPTAVSRAIYDNNNLGRVRIWGAVLNDLQLSADGRVATLRMDRALAARCGATYDDTEGLINFPLTVKEIEAVVFFKESGPGDWRISMRSKGDVNVNAIAREFGGGGHTNASGCGATGDLSHLAPQVLDVGSGLGGPARYLAATLGCDVTGIDLSPEILPGGQRPFSDDAVVRSHPLSGG